MEKVASVKLTLNGRGFLAGMRTLEGASATFGQKVAARLSVVSSTIKAWTADARRMARALPGILGAFAANPYAGMLTGLRALESRSISTFRKIGTAAKSAFSWTAQKLYGGGMVRGSDGQYMRKQGGLLSGKGGGGGATAGGIAFAMGVKDVLTNVMEKGVSLAENANSVSEKAAQLSVTARGAGGAYIDPKQLEAEAYAVTQQVKGTTAEQAVDAMGKFLTLSGDLDTARKSLLTFATASKATGADMGAIAEATASISKQFNITDPEQIKEVLASLTYQGKAGAIELTDLANGLQSVAAAGSAFGMSKDVEGVKKLGGFTQLARGGTGSAAQGFTAVENVFKALLEKSADFKKNRVNIYEGKGAKKHTRTLDDILVDAISKIGGKDVAKKNEKLGELFGGEAMRAINPLIGIYNTAYQGAKGTGGKDATHQERMAAGVAALRASFDSMIGAAGTWNDVMQDSAKMQQTNSAKLTASFQSLQGKVGDAVLPRLSGLVDKITQSQDAIDLFVTGLELMADVANDFAGLMKDLGLLKERPKTSLERRDEANAKADAAESELRSMQMPPGAIAELEKSDPKELAKLRARAKELDDTSFRERNTAKFWDDNYKKTPFAWDDEGAPVIRGSGGLREKMAEQRAALPAPAVAGAAQAGATGAVAAVAPGGRPGPVDVRGIGGTVKVHIVNDDTSRGKGAPSPLPGRYPRT